jgi:hypothetical protein
MKTVMLSCLVVLAGSSRHAPPPSASEIGFVGGSSRDKAVHQLTQIHATILTNTPELVRAEFNVRELKRPMQVELTFSDGRLAKTLYIPQ